MPRLPFDIADFPMLNVCVHPGCNAILLGEGPCQAHDGLKDTSRPDAADHREDARPERVLLGRTG
jgi:hypothetical protein